MNVCSFMFAGQNLSALGSRALWWPEQDLLCVSDLHLGKSQRMVRNGGPALPPYENRETLTRLASDLAETGASTVICLGDSFDDLEAAQSLDPDDQMHIATLQAGRKWVWIEGNHDPGPVELGGTHLAELEIAPLVFRHIAQNDACGEISGHYHPKVSLNARGRTITRPAFLVDDSRLILPAYGTYTGGLRSSDKTLAGLFGKTARAILTGDRPRMVPLPQ